MPTKNDLYWHGRKVILKNSENWPVQKLLVSMKNVKMNIMQSVQQI